MLTADFAHRRPVRPTLVLPLLLLFVACGGSGGGDPSTANGLPPDPSSWEVVLTEQPMALEDPDETLFIALSPVNEDTVWVAGGRFDVEALFARTVDGGATWAVGTVPGTEGLQFRDVHAFSGSTALLMSIGSGAESRIYRTEDAGETWAETFRMDHPEGFINCFDFWDENRGIMYGDAIEGGLWVATTADGGRNWSRIPPDRLPEPIDNEGGSAASGTCVDVRGTEEAFIVTTQPRVLATTDAGASWSWTPTPLEGGAGSVAVRSDGRGYLVKGGRIGNTAASMDAGRTWTASGRLPLPRGGYAVSWLPDPSVAVLFASGPSGIAWSRDGGEHWSLLAAENRWAVGFGSARVGWAVGNPGLVIRIDIREGK